MNSADHTTPDPVMPAAPEASMNALVPIMPRCPVMLVLDTSHSMYRGTALVDLHRSMRAFIEMLGKNVFKGATVDVAAVGMGDDLRLLDDFRPCDQSRLVGMRIRPKGDSPLGGALRLALGCLDRQEAGYRMAGTAMITPQLVVLSDGISTDDCSAQVAEVRRRVADGRLSVFSIALGPSANHAMLYNLAGANVLDPFGSDMLGAFTTVGAGLSQSYERATANSLRNMTSSARVSDGYFRRHAFYVDGTNVLYWEHNGRVRLDLVLALARTLKARGADYRVFFDASTPHKLREKGCPDDVRCYDEMLRLRPDRFVQVPAGSEADAFILMKADGIPNSIVVSQDRFHDREAIYPWVRNRDRHLTGMALDGELLFPRIGLRISL